MNNKLTHLNLLKRFVLVVGLCSVAISQSFAVEFTEGDYYVKVNGMASKEKEVREFYSFFCPACFQQESFMVDVANMLPEGVDFKKNHVDGMPGRNLEIEQTLTKALITAEKLGVKDKIVPAIFNYIHIEKAKFDTPNDVRNLFVINGVDAKEYDKTMSSFATNVGLKKMQSKTKAIRAQGYNSVPTLIINGKYKPVLNKLKSMEEYKALILFLLNK